MRDQKKNWNLNLLEGKEKRKKTNVVGVLIIVRVSLYLH